MANVTTTLDTRRAKSDGTFNVIFRITHFKKVYTINSGISIKKSLWDSSNRKVNPEHPNSKHLNIKLSREFYKIEQAVLLLDEDFTIVKLRTMLKSNNTTSVSAITFKEFAEDLIKQMLQVNRTGNAIVYQTAVNRLIAFSGAKITFDKIDYKLLMDFKHQLQVEGLKTNSISNYFRSLRAIYNQAIKQKLVERNYYPFHDISIKFQRTANRAISKVKMRELINLNLVVGSPLWNALNYFLLSFYLRGISFTDMAYLKQSNISNGRIHYERRKTHKLYSVKLFSPAKEIIRLYYRENQDYLLPILPNSINEDSIEAKKIITQWIKTTNKYLKRLGKELEFDISLTSYVSRYSIANIAKSLGYSNSLIAEALGHNFGNSTTAIYLDSFEESVLDEMHNNIIS